MTSSLEKDQGQNDPALSNTINETAYDDAIQSMPFVQHLAELRKRVFYIVAGFLVCACASYPFAADIYDILTRPLSIALGGQESRLIFTELPEVFVTYIKLSLFSGLIISFPWIAVQLWFFIAPGLYKTEKKFFLSVLVATPILFFAGVFFVYEMILPLAWKFFLSFQETGGFNTLPIELEAKVSDYFSITMKILFAFGLAFQLPLLMILLNRANLVSCQTFAKGRRYAIVIIFALSALITPPDVISQIALALPLILLYESSLFLMKKP